MGTMIVISCCIVEVAAMYGDPLRILDYLCLWAVVVLRNRDYEMAGGIIVNDTNIRVRAHGRQSLYKESKAVQKLAWRARSVCGLLLLKRSTFAKRNGHSQE